MLPDWLDKEAWEGFCQMRRAMKRVPFTDRAQKLIIRELDTLKAQGYDPGAVLDQSVMNGWRGVFPVRGQEPKRDYDFIEHGIAWKIVCGERVYVRAVQ
jgi:hypothetical protein